MKAIDALKMARDALKERRAYCEQWEYKYGSEWDNEDGYIQDAIDKLAEPEKTSDDDAYTTRDRILEDCVDGAYIDRDYDKALLIIKQYAETYHAKRCAECQKAKDSL